MRHDGCANAVLREPWAFDEQERLRRGGIASLPQVTPTDRDRDVSLRLGPRSAIARYLRSRRTWGIDENLSAEEVEKLITTVVAALRVRPKTSSWITKLSHHEADGREFQEREGIAVEIFPVLCKAATTVEPRNRAFYDPALVFAMPLVKWMSRPDPA